MEEVSHKEIYDRLLLLEAEVNDLVTHTKGMIAAFEAANGAFKVLDAIARITKPLITIGIFLTATYLSIQNSIKH